MEVIEGAGKLLGLAVANLGAAAYSASEDEEDTCWSREGSGATYEDGGSDDDDASGKRKRMSADDRKARNRERNRLHARKTRQRKKQHVQELQLKIWDLRQERQRLVQLSTDHRTAGVLLALSCSPKQCVQEPAGSSFSPSGPGRSPRSPPSLKLPAPAGRDWDREISLCVVSLRKITQEFENMDGGQQGGDDACGGVVDEVGSGGRSGGAAAASGKGLRGGKGTLADRTALRRERNRMHAKRTRNRKKLFVEACSVMIDKMTIENAQLEHEIQASGIRLPQASWSEAGQETVPEEPLPEYLAALWDFAEGKTHSPTPPVPGATLPETASSTTTTTPTRVMPTVAETTPGTRSAEAENESISPPPRHSRQYSCSSCTSSSSSSMDTPASFSSPALGPTPTISAPGQALEDASTLCAFMEAAQSRSTKRSRGWSEEEEDGGRTSAQRQRVWSDNGGSTTSESRGSSESDEEAAIERKATALDTRRALTAEAEAAVKAAMAEVDRDEQEAPSFWTSGQVLERYILPRQVC